MNENTPTSSTIIVKFLPERKKKKQIRNLNDFEFPKSNLQI